MFVSQLWPRYNPTKKAYNIHSSRKSIIAWLARRTHPHNLWNLSIAGLYRFKKSGFAQLVTSVFLVEASAVL